MIEQIIKTEPIKDKEAIQALLTLDEKERTIKSRQSYIHAYIWSILLPPIGIYYFIKYVFFINGTNDDFKAGVTSLVLTIISLLLSIWLFNLFFKQTTSLMPSQGNDTLRELITPANIKILKDLYQ
jgi:regulatory protein YycI of two-component signal transduction system YycFG